MKTFRQFLESKSVTVAGMKAFTSNLSQKYARYLIDKKGRLHVANAMDTNHDKMHKDSEAPGRGIAGYIRQKSDGSYEHVPGYVGAPMRALRDKEGYFGIEKIAHETKHGISHPLFKKFAKAGIKRAKDMTLDQSI